MILSRISNPEFTDRMSDSKTIAISWLCFYCHSSPPSTMVSSPDHVDVTCDLTGDSAVDFIDRHRPQSMPFLSSACCL